MKGVATDIGASLRHLIKNTLTRPSAVKVPARGSPDFLYALDEVDFDVWPGEVLGIIGRNGAGKTTLLKLLARVLEPTEGEVTLRGRVVSMLELGIGLAEDMTVAENIEMYGRLARIPSQRISALEDETIALAQLTEYRDVRLDRCPSGAFIQLAFATVVTLDADIILADEVLAVGDASFRRACEDRIRKARDDGGSILFVSHDMNAIRRICDRVMWIDRGKVRTIGPTNEVVDAYTAELLAGRLTTATPQEAVVGCRILELRLLDGAGAQVGAHQMTEPGYLDCIFRIDGFGLAVTVQFELWDAGGKKHILTSTTPSPIVARRPATMRAGLKFPADFFNDASYQLRCALYTRRLSDLNATPVRIAEDKLDFAVMNPHPERSVWADWNRGRGGLISPRLQWTLHPQEDRVEKVLVP